MTGGATTRTVITVGELMAALTAARAGVQPADVDAHTGPEIRAAMGWSSLELRRQVLALKAAGVCEVVKVRREDISGRMQTMPGYRLLAPATGKRR